MKTVLQQNKYGRYYFFRVIFIIYINLFFFLGNCNYLSLFQSQSFVLPQIDDKKLENVFVYLPDDLLASIESYGTGKFKNFPSYFSFPKSPNKIMFLYLYSA